jgi:hypothetical protein
MLGAAVSDAFVPHPPGMTPSCLIWRLTIENDRDYLTACWAS